MNVHLEIIAIVFVVSFSCALPGTFLVLRKRAMLCDAISHAVLPGIVIGFFLTGNLSSPLLMAGAVAAGLFTSWASEMLTRIRLIKEDAALGLIFPLLFSIGVILVSRHAGNVHLDTDAVLLGELAFAPFNRFIVSGYDLGPRGFWSMAGILVLNLAFILLFFKEVKLSTFDPGLAKAQGFSPVLIHYALMTMVSITVVSAFDSVGSILVVALMIAPAAAAFLLVSRLELMLILASSIGVISAIAGYGVAVALDLSIAGAIATFCGLSFSLALFFAPQRGIISGKLRRNEQKLELGLRMLVVHLSHHDAFSGGNRNDDECRRDHLTHHINWSHTFSEKVVQEAQKRSLISEYNSLLQLTEGGRMLSREAMTE